MLLKAGEAGAGEEGIIGLQSSFPQHQFGGAEVPTSVAANSPFLAGSAKIGQLNGRECFLCDMI